MSPPAVHDLYRPKTETLEILQMPTLTPLGRIGDDTPMRHIPRNILDLRLLGYPPAPILPYIDKNHIRQFRQVLHGKRLSNSPVIAMPAFLRLVVAR